MIQELVVLCILFPISINSGAASAARHVAIFWKRGEGLKNERGIS